MVLNDLLLITGNSRVSCRIHFAVTSTRGKYWSRNRCLGPRAHKSTPESWWADSVMHDFVYVSHLRPLVSLEPSSGKVLLLGTNSEVSIAPKLRGNTKHGSSRNAASNQPTRQYGQNATAAQKPEEDQPQPKKPAKVLRVLSRRVLPSDLTLPEVSTDLSVAFVSHSSLISLPELPRNAHGTSCWRVTIRRLRPPTDPLQESTPNNSSTQVTPGPRVLVPNGEVSSSHTTIPGAAEPKDEAILVCSPDVYVPQGHILLHEGLDGVEDWDLVR